MAKKLKKFLKKAGKAAAVAAALYGASKLGKRKGGQEGDIGIGLNAPYIGDVGSERTNRYKFDTDHLTTPSLAAEGGRIGAKKGGRVTGCAKRGFGRALKRK